MEELKLNLEAVFALARMQMVNSNPEAENDLINLINLKIDLYKELDKIPQKKEK